MVSIRATMANINKLARNMFSVLSKDINLFER